MRGRDTKTKASNHWWSIKAASEAPHGQVVQGGLRREVLEEKWAGHLQMERANFHLIIYLFHLFIHSLINQ